MKNLQHPQGMQAPPLHNRTGAGLETVITIEDLWVDIANELVRIGEDHIPVTATEFRILCTLMLQSAAVIRRDTLLSAITEKNTHATSRSLDVHISRLRTKLRSYGRWIRTFKGVGYRFMPTIAVDTAPQKGVMDRLI